MGHQRLRLAILAVDIAAIFVALIGAYLLRYGADLREGLFAPKAWLLLLGVATASWLVLYEPMSLDCFRDGWRLGAAVSRIEAANAIQMAAILAIAYLLRLYMSRLALAYFAVLFCALALAARLCALGILHWRRQAGQKRRVVIVGDGRVARELACRIERHPELLYEVAGFLNFSACSGNGAGHQPGNGSGSLSSFEVLKLLEQSAVLELFVCFNNPPALEAQNFLRACRQRGIRINLLPQTYELYSHRATLVEIDGVPLISVEEPDGLESAAPWKRAVDLSLASILFVPALPILVIAGTVLWFQGRRFLRCELRCGRQGQQFWMYRLDVDRDAPRMFSFHRLLCRLSITELPQLFNVLAGTMSLVGPRPESPERVRDYSEWQRQRLKIKPGMTGLAQVRGLREQHSSEDKTRYDLQYMMRWTPITDLTLLFETVWTLVARLWTRSESDLLSASVEHRPGPVLARPIPK